jgi:hypothetical protein
MYEIQVMRVNHMGGVVRGKRRAADRKELLYWVDVITGANQSDRLIEFTVRTETSNEDG